MILWSEWQVSNLGKTVSCMSLIKEAEIEGRPAKLLPQRQKREEMDKNFKYEEAQSPDSRKDVLQEQVEDPASTFGGGDSAGAGIEKISWRRSSPVRAKRRKKSLRKRMIRRTVMR